MNRLIFSRVASFSVPIQQAIKTTPKKYVRCNSTSVKTRRSDFVRNNHPTTPLSAYNKRLANQAIVRVDRKDVTKKGENVQKVLAIMSEMKERNIKPDIISYNSLLVAYARSRDFNSVISTLNEMEENGIQPTVDTYNAVLEVCGYVGDIAHATEMKSHMKEKDIALNSRSYKFLLNGMCNTDSIEFALDTLDEMKQSNIAPNLDTYNTIISTCLRLLEADTAFNLLKEAENSDLAVDSDPRIYMNVLRVGAIKDDTKIVEYCWNKAVIGKAIRPDEGTCLNVLRVAAKAGNTSLATDVIRQLSTSGYPYKEHYFTPLMEAFIVKDDLKNAFHVLDIMRVSGITPTARCALPLRQKLHKNVDAIDRAYYILEEMKSENKPVDITAFNTVLVACADAADLERTIATYREAKNLGVTPNVDTYNSVLAVCIPTRMKEMGDVVINEMKKADISPNLDTYSKMIALACTQKDYEEAFTYLEEMKSYDIVPPSKCYATLALKLAYQKDPRFYMVLEEMETYGYTVSDRLKTAFTRTEDDNINDRTAHRGDRSDYRAGRYENRGERSDNRAERYENRGERSDDRAERYENRSR